MTGPGLLVDVAQAALLGFVVASMLATGLALEPGPVLRPLRDGRLVAALLLVNFVLVPLVGAGLVLVLPLDDADAAAVVLLGCCAGAPFLPRLAQLAHGDLALAAASMVLLMGATVVYAPLVVPLLLPGAAVSAAGIAGSLVVTMLLPLAVGVLVRSRWPRLAGVLVGPLGQASSSALLVGVGAGLLVTWRDVLGSVGSFLFLACGLLLALSLVAGALLVPASRAGQRAVLGLAAAQRNIAAALVVAPSLGGDALVSTLVAALVVPVALLATAAELGRRRERRAGAAGAPGPRPA
ncbi:bile acid:sodium symporter family protein [Aquipuribacter sp. SD81]|uniref:bile acid:sodium symporter family protein n=1 Tax=Aquipuribacter sp. SD81 TaxID=3127703 RepID=UPI00301768E8